MMNHRSSYGPCLKIKMIMLAWTFPLLLALHDICIINQDQGSLCFYQFMLQSLLEDIDKGSLLIISNKHHQSLALVMTIKVSSFEFKFFVSSHFD